MTTKPPMDPHDPTPDATTTTAGACLRALTRRLECAGVYAPRTDAIALLGHAMGLDLDGETWPLPLDHDIDAKTAALAEAYAQRRENREPLARILGYSRFWGLKIPMASSVFRPDPEAEALIERALMICEPRRDEPLRLLDLGTGSGCLLFALLRDLPMAHGTGIDIDEKSLTHAARNAAHLGFQDRAVFLHSDWGRDLTGRYDLIIANPPAVVDRTRARLDPEMRCHETDLSLMGGADGLDAYRAIADLLDRLLAPDGWAVLRAHTWDREAALFRRAGYTHVTTYGNYRHSPRCVVIGAERKAPHTGWFTRLCARIRS